LTLATAAIASLTITPLWVMAQAKTPATASTASQQAVEQAEVVYQVMLAESLMRQQSPADAYALFADAARKSQDPQIFRRAAEAAWRAGLSNQSLAAARQWVELAPNDREAPRVVAQIYASLNRPKEAVPFLVSDLSRTPDAEKPVALASMQRVLGTAANKQAALEATREVLTSSRLLAAGAAPELGHVAHAVLARAAFAANDMDGGWKSLADAFDARADSREAAVGTLEQFERDIARATPLLNGYMQAAKAFNGAAVEYLRKLAAAKQLPQAAALAEQATVRHPKSAEAWLVLGNLRDQLEQPDAAEKAYMQAVQLSQASAAAAQTGTEAAAGHNTRAKDAALIALAANAEKRKDFPGAQEWINQIGDGELRDDARSRLVGSAIRAKDYRTAWRVIEAMPQTTGDERVQRWQLTGQVQRAEGKHRESLATYEKAIAEAPDNPEVLYEASFAAEKCKEYERMEQLLRRVMTLRPSFAHAYNALGYTLADRSVRLPEAKELVEKALELAPNDAYIIDSLGWVYYRMGKKEDALRELKRAYGIKPDTEIAAHMGEVLWELGRKEEALQTWRQAAGTASQSDTASDTLNETLKRYRVRF
jgi:tetratricopeptide (TPR) repeat protein